MAAAPSIEGKSVAAVDETTRSMLRSFAAGKRPTPMLRRLLLDALVNENRSDRPHAPNALVSGAARSATQWIGADPAEREKVLRDLLELAEALPPQPKSGPALPTKVSLVHKALEDGGIAHAFGGALAVAYYGEPRATGDIDVNVFVEICEWPRVKHAFAPLQIETEIDERELGRIDELRLEWGGSPVHLFFSSDALHEQMQRGIRHVPFGDDAIPLVSPEHLIIRKAILDRPKDWHDIAQIIVASYPLNFDEIGEWLHRIGSADDERVAKLDEIKTALDLQ